MLSRSLLCKGKRFRHRCDQAADDKHPFCSCFPCPSFCFFKSSHNIAPASTPCDSCCTHAEKLVRLILMSILQQQVKKRIVLCDPHLLALTGYLGDHNKSGAKLRTCNEVCGCACMQCLCEQSLRQQVRPCRPQSLSALSLPC